MMRDEILAKEPGRGLDAVVAREQGVQCEFVPISDKNAFGGAIFTRAREWVVDDYVTSPAVSGMCERIDDYSTDISAAMPLLDEMLSALDAQDRTWVLHRDRDKWAVSEMYHDDLIPVATGAEAPEAICKAYLIWRESENGP